MNLALNLFFRLGMLAFTADSLAHPDDPRYRGKGLPKRNLFVLGSFIWLFPALHRLSRRWATYPFGLDNLYLSIFWLDMAGNALGLYKRHRHFDVVTHFHGSGALVVLLGQLLRLPVLTAIGLANMLHIMQEQQEFAGDLLFGTHNVRGAEDVEQDIGAGLLGTALYGLALALLGHDPSHRRIRR